MVDTEIWLRLMSISSLYGDDMVRIAHWLAKQSQIDAVGLQQTGLTLRQAQRFLSFPRKSIESSLCWLEQPNHHLIPADSEFYPPQLLVTTDYPGALFVEGELPRAAFISACRSGESGAFMVWRAMGTVILRNSGDAWSDNYEWTGAWNRWCGA